MRRLTLTGQRMAVIFLAGLFLLYSPLITLFDRPHFLFGIPLLYLYLFAVWGVLIGLMAWVIGDRQ